MWNKTGGVCTWRSWNDVLEARKNIIEKINEQVEKVYVNKTDTVMDVDNLRWDCVDIFWIQRGFVRNGRKANSEKIFSQNITCENHLRVVMLTAKN